jgi:hypothetical protein
MLTAILQRMISVLQGVCGSLQTMSDKIKAINVDYVTLDKNIADIETQLASVQSNLK